MSGSQSNWHTIEELRWLPQPSIWFPSCSSAPHESPRFTGVSQCFISDFCRCAIVAPPLKIPKFEQFMQWHRSRDRDPGSIWLRSVLKSAIAESTLNKEAAPLTSARHDETYLEWYGPWEGFFASRFAPEVSEGFVECSMQPGRHRTQTLPTSASRNDNPNTFGVLRCPRPIRSINCRGLSAQLLWDWRLPSTLRWPTRKKTSPKASPRSRCDMPEARKPLRPKLPDVPGSHVETQRHSLLGIDPPGGVSETPAT